MNIIEGNKLIAEFMGLSSDGKAGYQFPFTWTFGRRLMPISMKYHDDWNWLMSVERKIFFMREAVGSIMITEFPEYRAVVELPMCADITEAYTTIVYFIKWYNECKKK